MHSYVTFKIIKIGNYFKLLFLILASIPVYAEQLNDQNVTINSGDTQSHTSNTILLDSGGPYTINNAGNIVSTAGVLLQLKCRQLLQTLA